MKEAGTNNADVRIGLCADCAHADVVQSGKGSRFTLCTLSRTNPKFPKYPRLPVRECNGYTKNDHQQQLH